MDICYLIGPNVTLGNNCQIEAFSCIGINISELSLMIGNDALFRSHTVIYGGAILGNNVQTGHGVLIRENSKIGNDVSIGSHSVIEHNVTIHNGVRIHSQVFIPEFTTLEDDCWIGPHVVFTNARYPRSPDVKKKLIGPTVKKAAKIGAHVTILPGVTIGENALIGAGAVVTKDVPAHSVVVGNPSRIINSMQNLPYV